MNFNDDKPLYSSNKASYDTDAVKIKTRKTYLNDYDTEATNLYAVRTKPSLKIDDVHYSNLTTSRGGTHGSVDNLPERPSKETTTTPATDSRRQGEVDIAGGEETRQSNGPVFSSPDGSNSSTNSSSTETTDNNRRGGENTDTNWRQGNQNTTGALGGTTAADAYTDGIAAVIKRMTDLVELFNNPDAIAADRAQYLTEVNNIKQATTFTATTGESLTIKPEDKTRINTIAEGLNMSLPHVVDPVTGQPPPEPPTEPPPAADLNGDGETTLQELKDFMKATNEEIAAANEENKRLQERLDEIMLLLADPNLSDEERTELIRESETIRETITNNNSRIEELNGDLKQAEEYLKSAYGDDIFDIIAKWIIRTLNI